MDIGSIFLILALAILVVLFISRPFWERNSRHQPGQADREDHDLSALQVERDRTIDAIYELDFDHTLGKVPEEDYPGQRARLLQYGADVLRKLDTFTCEEESRLEAAQQVTSVARHDEEIETIIAARRRQRSEKSAGFCNKCGNPLQKSDRFCSKCGTVVQ